MAEAIRAGLALIAVVLLARANVGVLTRSPAVWVALPVCGLTWAAAAWAARWSPVPGDSRLSMWRDCVTPALISVVMAGPGGSGSLTMAIGFVVCGSMVVGFASVSGRTNLGEPMRVRAEKDAVEPFELTPGVVESPESRHPLPTLQSDTLQTPLPIVASVQTEAPPVVVPMEEFREESVAESSPAETWTRREIEGEVSIEAVVLARFAEGSKLSVVHLPFVPPLPAVPQMECEPLDSGSDLLIQPDAVYRHGARLSVTRQSAGAAETVPIGVVVYTSAEEEIEL